MTKNEALQITELVNKLVAEAPVKKTVDKKTALIDATVEYFADFIEERYIPKKELYKVAKEEISNMETKLEHYKKIFELCGKLDSIMSKSTTNPEFVFTPDKTKSDSDILKEFIRNLK